MLCKSHSAASPLANGLVNGLMDDVENYFKNISANAGQV